MYVTQHAASRIAVRLDRSTAEWVERVLDGHKGEQGVVAYIVGNVPAPGTPPELRPAWWLDSNGDTLIAVANEGSVETVFFRRASQDMSAGFFGARKVVDLRHIPLFEAVS